MTDQEQEQERNPSFTFTHVLLLSLFITTISLNKVKEIGKNSLENSKKLAEMKYQYLRNLDFKEDTENVCSKADAKLQKYYKTGDKSLIGLNNSKRKQSTASYIKTLTDIVVVQAGGSSKQRFDDDQRSNSADSTDDDSGTDSNLRENLKKYLMHATPVLAFLVIAILSIPGWIVCFCCFCCNCCCCCCCKRFFCRFPLFIVVMVFDAIVFIACIYGLANSNKIFAGFANLECSLMKFIEEVNDGQTKDSLPKWGGFEGIREVLNNATDKIKELRQGTMDRLKAGQSSIEKKQITFTNSKGNFTNKYYYGCSSFYNTYDTTAENYCLLTYMLIGPEENGALYTFNKMLEGEYQIKVKDSKTYIDDTVNNFGQVLNNTAGNQIEPLLDSAMNSIDSIKKPVDDVKGMVYGNIASYSDMIDEKGKLIFKLVYAVLTIVVVVKAALFVVYFEFGATSCLKCRVLRRLNKVFIHILWNILALLMIVTFIIGAVLTLVGTIGKDLASVVSFLISEDNLNSTNSVLIKGDAATYLTPCLNGNGELSKILNIDTSSAVSSITELQNLTAKIDAMRVKFEEIKYSIAVHIYMKEINKNTDEKKTDLLSKVFDTIALCPTSTGFTDTDKCLPYSDSEKEDSSKPSYYINKDIEVIKNPLPSDSGLINDLI